MTVLARSYCRTNAEIEQIFARRPGFHAIPVRYSESVLWPPRISGFSTFSEHHTESTNFRLPPPEIVTIRATPSRYPHFSEYIRKITTMQYLNYQDQYIFLAPSQDPHKSSPTAQNPSFRALQFSESALLRFHSQDHPIEASRRARPTARVPGSRQSAAVSTRIATFCGPVDQDHDISWRRRPGPAPGMGMPRRATLLG